MNFPNSKGGISINLEEFDENDLLKILFNESPGILIQTNKLGKENCKK